MTEQNRQELQGQLYAQELILNVLLKSFIDLRLADTGQDTEHLDTFVRQLQASFEAQATKMTPVAASSAKNTLFRLLDASCQKYWT